MAPVPHGRPEAAPHLDSDWLRDLVETLASIHRPTASQGERVAAEWLAARLARARGSRGAGRVRTGPRHLLVAARPRRRRGGRGGLAGPAGPPGAWWGAGRRGRRGRCRRPAAPEPDGCAPCCRSEQRPRSSPSSARPTPSAPWSWWPITTRRTPACSTTPRSREAVFGRFPWLHRAPRHQPAPDRPRRRRPALVGAGALTGSRALAKAGTALWRRSRRRRWPTSACATPFQARTTTPPAWRRCWPWRARSQNAHGERAGDAGLDLGGGAVRGDAGLRQAPLRGCRARAPSSLTLDTLGSPHLLVLRGEGMIRMREYPRSLAGPARRARRRAGHPAVPEPAPAQRHRRRHPARRRVRLRRAVLVHPPQAAGQLPLAHRRPGERGLRHARPTPSVSTEAVVRRLDERWL